MDNFMASKEIADDIDKSQFQIDEDNGDIEKTPNISEMIIIHLDSEKALIPGIIQEYSYGVTNFKHKLSLVFTTQLKNIAHLQQNIDNFLEAKLYIGEDLFKVFSLNGMVVEKLRVQQTPASAGCVITVVYQYL